MREIIKLQPQDNVAVVLKEFSPGQEIKVGEDTITVLDKMTMGHKIALSDLSEGSPVIKYGYPIGITSKAVKKGEWIHTHNLKTGLGEVLDYSYQPIDYKEEEDLKKEDKYFYGYRRKNGLAGIRNEIWIIPTVGCVNDGPRF